MPENALAAAAEQELHKITFWYGDPGRDSFTAEYWIQRVERIRTATQWNDETTASHALNSLRGRALFFLQHHEIHCPATKLRGLNSKSTTLAFMEMCVRKMRGCGFVLISSDNDSK